MSEWLTQTIAQAEAVDDWLSPKRQQALALLREQSWPTRKTEDWKYTPLTMLERADWASVASTASPKVEPIQGLDAIDLILVDGQLQAFGAELPHGLKVVSLSEAEAADQARIANAFGAVKPQRHLFGLVNDVLATDGVFIDVDEGAVIEQPLRIVYSASAGAQVHSRALVRVGKGARVSIIEQTLGDSLSFNTGFAEYQVGAGALLEHYRFNLQCGDAMAVGGSHFALQDDAELNSTLVGFGSRLSRLDVDVIHAGEGARAKLNAIYLLDGKELFDLHSTIEHAKPQGTTEENVRGIVADQARAVFNGRIHIHRHAQKTVAELNNRNLLMSPEAEVNTKPELEIYADDVRCAHGATVAEIDKKGLYYLQTRGIGRTQAQVMLSFGFINELVDQMPNAELAEWLRPQLRDRFAGMNVK